MICWPFRHRWTWDLRALSKPDRKVLQAALCACDYPFHRIRLRTGGRVPVTVSDLSRFSTAASHAHATGPNGEVGHVLMEPDPGGHGHVHFRAHGGKPQTVAPRRAALGLYWLPTSRHPAGRVEIDTRVMAQPDLAREVFLAEAAHAVDYGVPITPDQRRAIFAAYHPGEAADHGHDWFPGEEGGDPNIDHDDYWSWVGESFMSGFMRAFAPSLPRPMEARQRWTHPTTAAVAARIREVLL